MISEQAFIPPPCDFLCPITQEIMRTPVLLVEDVSEHGRVLHTISCARSRVSRAVPTNCRRSNVGSAITTPRR